MRAARIDHGPIAMTTASPSTISPSTTRRPRRAPRCSTRPLTRPTRSSAPRLGRAHHRGGNCAGMNLRRGFGRAQPLAHAHAGRQPAEIIGAGAARAGRRPTAAIGVEPAIAPVAPDLLGEPGMQREAAAGQRAERRAVAPVERQKAARLARRRACDRDALDDGRMNPAAAQEIGDRGADHAAAANHNTHQAANRRSSKGHMDSALTIGQDACGVVLAVGKPP